MPQRLQTGAVPLKRATVVVEWEEYDDSNAAVLGTVNEMADALQRALWPLGVNPTVVVEVQ